MRRCSIVCSRRACSDPRCPLTDFACGMPCAFPDMSHYSTTSWRFASTNVDDSPDQHLLHTMATPAASSSSHNTAAATGRAQTYPASADARMTSGAAGGHHSGDSLFVSPPSPSLHGAQAGNTSLFSPSFSPVRFDSEPEGRSLRKICGPERVAPECRFM